MRDKVIRQCPQTTTFKEKGSPSDKSMKSMGKGKDLYNIYYAGLWVKALGWF